jgi:hypothetical protein
MGGGTRPQWVFFKLFVTFESRKLAENQFAITRGIDDGDADFLSQVDRIKEEQETRKRQEELELLELAKQQSVIPAHEPAQERLDRPQRSVPKQTTSKQASLLSSLVRKRFCLIFIGSFCK